jgi:hypothetical protein
MYNVQELLKFVTVPAGAEIGEITLAAEMDRRCSELREASKIVRSRNPKMDILYIETMFVDKNKGWQHVFLLDPDPTKETCYQYLIEAREITRVRKVSVSAFYQVNGRACSVSVTGNCLTRHVNIVQIENESSAKVK